MLQKDPTQIRTQTLYIDYTVKQRLLALQNSKPAAYSRDIQSPVISYSNKSSMCNLRPVIIRAFLSPIHPQIIAALLYTFSDLKVHSFSLILETYSSIMRFFVTTNDYVELSSEQRL